MGRGGKVDDDGFAAEFGPLYRRSLGLATKLLGDRVAAEDVAAEALARTYAHWPRLSQTDHIAPWVLRVTANLAIDATRRRRPVLPAAAVAVLDPAVELRDALVAALLRLPRRQREVVALRYLTDLDEATVAAALGISTGSVKTHLSRGLAALRSRLPAPDLEALLAAD